MITLTPGERQKFAAWLRQDATSDRLLLQQMANLPAINTMASRRKLEMNAKLFVAAMLESIESQMISREDAQDA